MQVRPASLLLRLVLVALVVVIMGAVATAPWRARVRDPILASLAKAIREAEAVELHEGTRPRYLDRDPTSRPKEDESAIATIGYDRFYREPTRWNADDALTLGEILAKPSSYEPVTLKKCMGFHADFAVEWKVNGKSFFVMICFGCGELRVVTPDAEQIYDQAWDTQWDLLRILRGYRERRPVDHSEIWRDHNVDGTTTHADVDHPQQLESIRGVTRWGSRVPN